MRKIQTITAVILLSGLFCRPGFGQSAPATVITVDIENWVEYVYDNPDTSTWATHSSPTPASIPKNFTQQLGIADVVAVNGEPVKGTMVRTLSNMNLSPVLAPGKGIGDAPRGAVVSDYFEIEKMDGTAIGTIFLSGIVAGPAAPGAPLAVNQGNFAVVGGTGAFLGVQGQSGQNANPQIKTLRQASVTEDPAYRRQNGGGGRVRWVMHLIPMERPEIVSSFKPPERGVLSLYVKGLGPTVPGVDPRSPFPANPTAVVNSPVAVTVNGQDAEVLSAVGYPGAVDGYQVDIRVPPGTGVGMASVQVSSAWINGPAAKIPIRQ